MYKSFTRLADAACFRPPNFVVGADNSQYLLCGVVLQSDHHYGLVIPASKMERRRAKLLKLKSASVVVDNIVSEIDTRDCNHALWYWQKQQHANSVKPVKGEEVTKS